MKKNLILASLSVMTFMGLAQVPGSGLIGRWSFNGTLSDATPGANNGTWHGAAGSSPLYVNDRCNRPKSALRFNGTTDYVEMKFAGPPNDDARSLSFWMRTDNTVSGDQSIVRGIFNYGYYTTGTTGSRWEICHNYGCEGVGVDISHEYFTTASNCVNNGNWHHVVITQEQAAPLHDARIYIDGILMPAPSVEPVYPSGMPNCSPTSNTGPNATDIGMPTPQFKVITIGAVLGSLLTALTPGVPGRFFDGDLDDFFLYNRVLKPVEVAQLFAEQCEIRPCISCPPEATDPGEGGHDPKERSGKIPQINLSDKNVIVLDQNAPNPFAESTVISYTIPEKFSRAQIIFTTTTGKVFKVHDITEKGKGQLSVFGDNLSTGVYAYKLVVDGKTIDTKKMIKE